MVRRNFPSPGGDPARQPGPPPNRGGFRGAPPPQPPALVSVECSVCHRKRNVSPADLPANREQYVCLRCAESAKK